MNKERIKKTIYINPTDEKLMRLFPKFANNVLFGMHKTKGGLSRLGMHIGARFAAHNDMAKLRLQLRSYEGRELFDTLKLARYLKEYHRARRHLMRYSGKDENGVSTYGIRIRKKYFNKPELFEKVKAHEAKRFSEYYQRLLDVVSGLRVDINDLMIQQNAAIMKDENKLTELIKSIREIPASTSLPSQEQLDSLLTALYVKARGNIARMQSKELWERRRLERGKSNVLGFGHFFLKRKGLNSLAHYVKRGVKWLSTHEFREFNRNLTSLRRDIENKKVTDVTISNLKFIIENFPKMRKYYHEVDQDMALIMKNILADFKKVLNECVIPFYTWVRDMPHADTIKEITSHMVFLHEEYIKEASEEYMEADKVKDALEKMIKACNATIQVLKEKEKEASKNAIRELGLTERKKLLEKEPKAA